MSCNKSYLQMFSGTRVLLSNPKVEDIQIIDIAHGLSNICRYAGQVDKFYSVAEHSILCALMSPMELRLEALLHDATEAYLGDMTRPLKMMIPQYRIIEGQWDLVIRERFGLPLNETPKMKQADHIMNVTELLAKLPPPEDRNKVPSAVSLDNAIPNFEFLNLTSEQSRKMFLNTFYMLGGK